MAQPVVLSCIPPRARNSGGTVVVLTITNFPTVTAKEMVMISIAGSIAPVSELLRSDKWETIVKLVLPPIALTGRVAISVGHKMTLLRSASVPFELLGTKVLFVSVFPRTISSDGGATITVRLSNVLRDVSTAEVHFMCKGSVGTVLAAVHIGDQLSVRALSPVMVGEPKSTTEVMCKVSVDNAGSVTFPLALHQGSAQMTMSPTMASTSGGTSILVRLPFNAASMFSGTADAIFVWFGAYAGIVTAVDFSNSTGYILVRVTAPPMPTNRLTNLAITAKMGTSVWKMTSPFSFFEPCDYKSYCALNDAKIPDLERLRRSPPIAPGCTMRFCTLPPPEPFIISILPVTALCDCGGESVLIFVAHFPFVANRTDVRVTFGETVSTDVQIRTSSKHRTVFEINTPRIIFDHGNNNEISSSNVTRSTQAPRAFQGGTLPITVAHLTSRQRAQVTVRREFYKALEGDPVLRAIAPTSGPPSGGFAMVLQMENAPEIESTTAATVWFGDAQALVTSMATIIVITDPEDLYAKSQETIWCPKELG